MTDRCRGLGRAHRQNGLGLTAFEYYERLARVKTYFEEHMSEPFPIQMAARVACLSEKYFSTFFRQKTGIYFKDWIGALRIERAQQLIREGNKSLTDVAFDVGFRDMRTFERAFKKHVAMTPRAYKQSVRVG